MKFTRKHVGKVLSLRMPNAKRKCWRWITKVRKDGRAEGRAPKSFVRVRDLEKKRDADYGPARLLPQGSHNTKEYAAPATVTLRVTETPKAKSAYKAVFSWPDGHTRTIAFGTRSNYVRTKQKTAADRAAYIKRHAAPKSRQNHNNPFTAGALSRHLLWGESRSLDTNLAAFKDKFQLR